MDWDDWEREIVEEEGEARDDFIRKAEKCPDCGKTFCMDFECDRLYE